MHNRNIRYTYLTAHKTCTKHTGIVLFTGVLSTCQSYEMHLMNMAIALCINTTVIGMFVCVLLFSLCVFHIWTCIRTSMFFPFAFAAIQQPEHSRVSTTTAQQNRNRISEFREQMQMLCDFIRSNASFLLHSFFSLTVHSSEAQTVAHVIKSNQMLNVIIKSVYAFWCWQNTTNIVWFFFRVFELKAVC